MVTTVATAQCRRCGATVMSEGGGSSFCDNGVCSYRCACGAMWDDGRDWTEADYAQFFAQRWRSWHGAEYPDSLRETASDQPLAPP